MKPLASVALVLGFAVLLAAPAEAAKLPPGSSSIEPRACAGGPGGNQNGQLYCEGGQPSNQCNANAPGSPATEQGGEQGTTGGGQPGNTGGAQGNAGNNQGNLGGDQGSNT